MKKKRKMEVDERNDCPVCLEEIKGHRILVECPKCSYAACRPCTRQYIGQSHEDAHCMNCKNYFDRRFLAESMGTTFMSHTYKTHRENIVFQSEQSMLPESMERLAHVEEHEIVKSKIDETLKQLHEREEELYKLRAKHERDTRDLRNQVVYLQNYADEIRRYTTGELAEKPAPIGTFKEELEKQMQESEKRRKENEFATRGHCPKTDCNGLIGQGWTCTGCEAKVCKTCMEDITNKEFDHECDPAIAESVAAIRKECKPCPQCRVRVFKIRGCFGPDVKIRLYNGEMKEASKIEVGDVLVGDDFSSKRIVEETFTGEDEMFLVKQGKGEHYTVNSKHTLVLAHSHQGVHQFGEKYRLAWLDRNALVLKTCIFNKLEDANSFLQDLKLGPYVKMTVEDYMGLSDNLKATLWGVHMNEENLGAHQISVESVGKGIYYGWKVSGKNELFLGSDDTIFSNCSQMFCTACHVAFDWNTMKIIKTKFFHNPHYTDWVNSGRQRGAVYNGEGCVTVAQVASFFSLNSVLGSRMSQVVEKANHYSRVLGCTTLKFTINRNGCCVLGI